MFIKKIIIIVFLLFQLQTVCSNPFRTTSSGTGSVPIVRSSGSPSPAKLVEIQMRFRSKMAELIIDIKENKSPRGLMLLLFIGFLYGIVHAAGPGHRKTVLFSIFLSNKSKWWEPGVAGSLSAFLHGFSGIVLILIFKEFSNRFLSHRVDLVSTYMETGSFLLLLLIALLLFVLKLKSLLNANIEKTTIKENRSFYYTVLLTSIFPCPGAILILILALSQNVLNIGILTVIFLSLGMGLTISITGYLGRGGRIGLFKIIKTKESKIEKVANYLELLGYLFLSLFSLWMVMPLIIS